MDIKSAMKHKLPEEKQLEKQPQKLKPEPYLFSQNHRTKRAGVVVLGGRRSVGGAGGFGG